MAMNAIPTEYAGIRFRSRLEATWASFFDMMQWGWFYEPVDLIGYIPDFILVFPFRKVLVEVKPVTSIADMGRHCKKIVESGWREDAIIVGAEPLVTEFPTFTFWWIGCPGGPDDDGGFTFFEDTGAGVLDCYWCRRRYPERVLNETCPYCGRESPSPPDKGSPPSRWVGVSRHPDEGLLSSIWATAKNRTQWRGAFGS